MECNIDVTNDEEYAAVMQYQKTVDKADAIHVIEQEFSKERMLKKLERLALLYPDDEEHGYVCANCNKASTRLVKMSCDRCPLQLYCIPCLERIEFINMHHTCLTCMEHIETTTSQPISLAREVAMDARAVAPKAILYGSVVAAALLMLSLFIYAGGPSLYFNMTEHLDVLLNRQYYLEMHTVTNIDDDGHPYEASVPFHYHASDIFAVYQLVFFVGASVMYWFVAKDFYAANHDGDTLANQSDRTDTFFTFMVQKRHFAPFYPLAGFLLMYLPSPFVIYGFFYFIFEPYIYHAYIPKSWDWLCYENLYYVVIYTYYFVHSAIVLPRKTLLLFACLLFAIPLTFIGALSLVAGFCFVIIVGIWACFKEDVYGRIKAYVQSRRARSTFIIYNTTLS